VRTRDVTIATLSDRIDVNLSARLLEWTREGRLMMRTIVGIGGSSSPTPPGTFFVTDVLREDASGAYGAWLLALNAHSDAFPEVAGTDVRIAIHGTNAPASVGAAVSNGCVRVGAEPLAALAAAIQPGTPVQIR
jgi:hypothetical protein